MKLWYTSIALRVTYFKVNMQTPIKVIEAREWEICVSYVCYLDILAETVLNFQTVYPQ